MAADEPATDGLGMSQRGAFVYLNSRLVPAAAAHVSVFDRAFSYGDALFETMKLRQGVPVFFDDHFKRLKQGMKECGFISTLEPIGLRNQALSLAQANDVRDGRLRIMLSRGTPPSEASIDPGIALTPTLLLTAEPFAGHPEAMYTEGVACVTVPANRGFYARLKSTSLITTIMARRIAHDAGAYEAIFTTGHGRMLEGSISNLFVHDDDRLWTAPDSMSILAGVTRQKVLEIAAEAGMAVEFEAPKPEDLTTGETSAFLTGSVLGVCPVNAIDESAMAVDTELTGMLAERLLALEQQSIRLD